MNKKDKQNKLRVLRFEIESLYFKKEMNPHSWTKDNEDKLKALSVKRDSLNSL